MAAAGAARAQAQLPAPAEQVTVTGTRVEERRFDVAASVDRVEGGTLREQQPGVNLSEGLQRVPGLVIQNRQNYAQDLQVAARGFGARATFGVRGVRLLQDGIPLTMPDGQGQTALFDLDNARAVEVLRGPFAALYGNASGGVIQLFTAPGPQRPTLRASAYAGSFGTRRLGLGFGGTEGGFNYSGDAARFETDGWRAHSAARRDTANARLQWRAGEDTTVTVLANTLDQPDTQDPLGLTQAQLDADRRQAGSNAEAFDTRKSIRHQQGGLGVERRLGAGDSVQAVLHGGQRRLVQTLAIPVAAQGPTSSGGVVDLDRGFGGATLEWRHRGAVAGLPMNFTLGIAHDRMSEDRRGYVNDRGVQGALRRDETDRVRDLDEYLIGNLELSPAFKLSAGVRHSDVRFDTADRFVAGANPDDSGAARYSRTVPVAGLLWRASERLHVFASAGRGFETPTFAELAYRSDGQPGMNFGLRPALSRNAEVGARWSGEQAKLTVAAFDSRTRDEVVSASSSGGRNTFANAERTRRRGVELSLDVDFGDSVDALLAYTRTEARFEHWVNLAGTDLSGRSIPGVPRDSAYAELRWQPAAGWSAAVELRAVGRLPANDANTAFAAGYAAANLRGGWEGRLDDAWRLRAFARVENVADRRYTGSVIVNEANQRFFEPAPERAWGLGLQVDKRF